MRVNIYSQELTSDFRTVEKRGNDGSRYSALLFFLHSSTMLHQPPEHIGEDDDRSAVAFWLPKSPERREELAQTFEKMAQAVRNAPSETPV